MRIILVVPNFPAVSETFIVDKFVGLVDRGLDVHVTCRASDPDLWALFPALIARPELRRRVHPWPTPGRPVRVLHTLAVMAATCLRADRRGAVLDHVRSLYRRSHRGWPRQLLRDGWFLVLRPDVIHFEFGSDAAERGGLPRLVGCPMTVSFRGYDLNYEGLDDERFFDALWPHLAAVHALGGDLWRRARARGCPAELPHTLIPPAVDSELFHPPEPAPPPLVAGTPDRPLRLLSVGRLHWKKGHEYAVEAVALLQERGLVVEYRIVGAGPDEDAVRAAIDDFGVDGAVTLLGAVPRAAVREELAAADVFVHAAVSEGFCNAVLEAQSMALPVVCSDADGLAENVVHGVTGFVVARRDAEAIAERLAALAGDAGLRIRLGAAGRERARTAFRPEDQLAAFAAFFASVGRDDLPVTSTARPTLRPSSARPRSHRAGGGPAG